MTVFGGSAAGVFAVAPSASAYPLPTVSLTGHGYGHGHGMGQWGALGYALAGTNYQSIVSHYYGGSALSGLNGSQEATNLRVDLTENDGNTVIVTSGSPFSVAGAISVPANQAVLMVPIGGGEWNLSTGAGCAGPTWTPRGTYANPTAAPQSNPPPGDPNAATKALQLCQGGGNLTVRGTIEGTYNSLGSARTVNTLPLEQYVSAVVPNESPAGWGTLGGAGPQGQRWGFQELEAQAVAVRSYAMAGLGSYGGYADTCDLVCQTYRGIRNESAISDLAVSDTSAEAMELHGGAVAATQYSASTGGYTNPGGFPAVPDTGDSVCVPGACNANHTWTTSIAVATIDATWPQLGTLQAITITGRNGDGDWGGRVTAMTLVGSNQNVSLTGDSFAGALGLKSNWFAVTSSLTSPAVAMAPTADGKGYWVAGSNGGIFSFGDAAFHGAADNLVLRHPVVGMASTPDGKGYWLVASDGGIFAYGDAPFYGSAGSIVLNKPMVGMVSTPDGKGYWLVASDGGIFAYGDARFSGSMGGHPLNQPIVGMTTVPQVGGYRLVAADGGIFSFGSAVFYGSTGSIVLAKPIVGMSSTSDGHGYWMVASDGGIFAFGDAHFYGSAAG
jgi:SpoIID/LytB domain protein